MNEIKKGYEDSKNIKWWSEHYNEQKERQFIKKIIESIPDSGDKLLDIGCGIGMHSFIFKNLGKNVIALDYSKKMCDYAKNHYGLDVIRGDALKLPFTSEKFDITFTCGLSTIVGDEDIRIKSVREMRRITKKGGYIILSTPSDKSIYFKFKKDSLHHLDDRDEGILQKEKLDVISTIYWGILPGFMWKNLILRIMAKFLELFSRSRYIGIRKVVICRKK
ncbi:MAG: hypothetical protein DRP62_03945 [Planctomycetota bacterium]|nr:MAG: hypothetical protein DRP62_03945 [Planctomycetota bacterium]